PALNQLDLAFHDHVQAALRIASGEDRLAGFVALLAHRAHERGQLLAAQRPERAHVEQQERTLDDVEARARLGAHQATPRRAPGRRPAAPGPGPRPASASRRAPRAPARRTPQGPALWTTRWRRRRRSAARRHSRWTARGAARAGTVWPRATAPPRAGTSPALA